MTAAVRTRKGRVAVVARIPRCDIPQGHPPDVPAFAGARMLCGPHAGRWAFVCRAHFTLYGCRLGLGFGQELVKQ
jgi:hypothetical protein